MLGSLGSNYNERRRAQADGLHEPVGKIDVTRYLDDIEGILQSSNDVGMRNEALAILRRWQFDSMLTDDACARAARLLRAFTDVAKSHKGLT